MKLGSTLGLVAAVAVVAGLGGCSLPEVLPLAGATTQGPSPYGPWYEQHWATNAVLLAAADQPEGGEVATDDLNVGDTEADDNTADQTSAVDEGKPVAHDTSERAIEASAEAAHPGEDFDASTPYQFPSSAFAPKASSDASSPSPSVEELTPPATKAPASKAAPAPSGPIRY